MPQIKQNADGSAGFEGVDAGAGMIENASYRYIATTAATSTLYVAPRSYVVQSIVGRVDVAGTGGACTVSFYKVPTGTAPASGVLLHSGTYNIVGTANAVQTLTLSVVSGATTLAAGDSICAIITGTATSAVGCVTVGMTPR